MFTKTFVGTWMLQRVTGGSIMYDGEDVAKYKEKDWLKIRGKKIAMVMQDPMTSLNPLRKAGQGIQESIEHHQGLGAEAKKAAIERRWPRSASLSAATTSTPMSSPAVCVDWRRHRHWSCSAILEAWSPATITVRMTIRPEILDLINFSDLTSGEQPPVLTRRRRTTPRSWVV